MTLRARGALALPFLVFAGACGAFSSSDDTPPAPPPPEDERAKENAAPPVAGAPLEGVFVSSSRGKDTNDGTASAPLATLAAGIARAKEFRSRVIACAEEYREAPKVVSGVSMFGAYDCSASPWAKSDKRAVIRAPTSPALEAVDIPLKVRIDGFEIIAPDLDATPASAPGTSSIAVRLSNVLDIELANVRAKAGKGGPGQDGVDPPPPPTPAAASGAVGRDQGTTCANAILCAARTYNPGGTGGFNSTCAEGGAPGPGGEGGSGLWYKNGVPQNGHNVAGQPYAASSATAQGATTAAGQGSAGAMGAPGTNGTSATGFSFDITGAFTSNAGTPGGAGAGGQGGGGGGAAIGYYVNGVVFSYAVASAPEYYFASTGGGGGAGGCGGLPGTGGQGGGASVALLSLKSKVAALDLRLEASFGGPGGAGALGSLGGAGGGGGGGGTVYAGAGGAGGVGGPAGLSGHGATGPSIAMVFQGQEPSGALTLLPGSSGPGRQATTRTVGSVTQTMPAAPSGEAVEKYEIKP